MPLRRLALGGADLILMAMQSLWAGAHVSNNTLLVVECDGPISPARVRRAADRILDVCPWPAARLSRPFPWGRLHWVAGPRAALSSPPVRHRVVASPVELHAELEAELGAAIDPAREPPLRFLLLDCAGGPARGRSNFVVTWYHPFMDARGGQNLLRHLVHADQLPHDVPWNGVPSPFPAQEPPARPLSERGRLARRSRHYMRALTTAGPVSPGTGLASPGPVRFRRQTFVEGGAADARATRGISWRLALVGKAMADLWKERRLPDAPFLVPISVDLRPKGEPGSTVGNALAFHFARFRPSETGDVASLADRLRAQMVQALRDGQIEANAVAMEFLKYRPLSMMLRDLPGTARKETFSFFCADIVDFPALPSLFGRRVVNAYHAPAVVPRPGCGVFFNRCRTLNNLVVSWIEGAVSEDEVTRIMEVVREGMGWTPTA